MVRGKPVATDFERHNETSLTMFEDHMRYQARLAYEF